MNKHDELIARLENRPEGDITGLEIDCVTLLQLYGDALERLANDQSMTNIQRSGWDGEYDARIEYARKTIESVPQSCEVDSYSSRICERGTKCCTVYHNDTIDEGTE